MGRPRTVVRLSRSVWHDRRGIYQRTTIRYLKRRSSGFNVCDDDCRSVGAAAVVPRILNLAECADGVYLLEMCDERRDRETSAIEEWNYRLYPCPENELEDLILETVEAGEIPADEAERMVRALREEDLTQELEDLRNVDNHTT